MRGTSTHHRRGLTLVEVLVALVLLAGAVHGALALQLVTLRAARRTNDQQRMALHAASILDSLSAPGCMAVTGRTSVPEGTIHWNVGRAPGALTIDLGVAPAAGAPWQAEQVVPC